MFIVCGCGGSGDAPKLFPVEGILTIDGAPVANVTVSFIPDNSRGAKGPASSGLTDATGKFSLKGPDGRPGAIPGFHKVTASCPFDLNKGSSPTGEAPPKDANGCSIPGKYSMVDYTTLTAEVKDSAEANADLKIDVSTKK